MNIKPITRHQTTHHIGETDVVLESIAVRAGGLAWARPAAVHLRGAAGEQRLPIRDVTRRWQALLYAVAALCVVIGIANKGRPLPSGAATE